MIKIKHYSEFMNPNNVGTFIVTRTLKEVNFLIKEFEMQGLMQYQYNENYPDAILLYIDNGSIQLNSYTLYKFSHDSSKGYREEKDNYNFISIKDIIEYDTNKSLKLMYRNLDKMEEKYDTNKEV